MEVNVLWMYPDLLNNYGDRGNIKAIEKVANLNNIKVNIKRIDSLSTPIPYDWADIILFNPGELRTMKDMSISLKKNFDELKNYIENGKYVFVFNQTVSIFADETIRVDMPNFKGLNLLNLDVYEKRRIFGDNIIVKTLKENIDLLGVQIQLSDYKLKNVEPFAEVVYGYGNWYKSGFDGARYKNLIWTNLEGPLFFKNPWFIEEVLLDICGESNEYNSFNINDYIEKYPIEIKSFNLHNKYIKEKEKLSEENMKEYLQ